MGAARSQSRPRSSELLALEGAQRASLPTELAPQLATLSKTVPTGDRWLHELKYDGYRILARWSGRNLSLLSRRGNEWSAQFPGLAAQLRALRWSDTILDGEVVVLDQRGISRFQSLQNAFGDPNASLVYMAFDAPFLAGIDLRGVALLDRKQALERWLEGAAVPASLRRSDHVVGRGAEFFAQACAAGLEGIVSKQLDAPYRSRRETSWLKIKCMQRQEFVILGFTEPGGSRVGLGALLLGVHEDGELRFAGKVGTGFDGATLVDLRKRLEPLRRSTSPLPARIRTDVEREARWVEPRLVAEVNFTEWTADGRVRHPSFVGLRFDKRPRDVVRES